MSTKPTTVATFDSGNVNTAAITAGHGTSGFANSEVPTAAEINQVFRLAGLWQQYLSDAALTGGASVAGGFAVDTVTASGLVTANAGVTAGANQSVRVSGTGSLKHGIKVFHISPYNWISQGSSTVAPTFTQTISAYLRADWILSSGALKSTLELSRGLQNGQRIVNARVYMKDVSGQSALTATVYGGDRAGSSTANGVTATSAASGSTQTLTLTALNHTMGTTTPGPVQLILATAFNSTGTYSVFDVEIDVDYP